MRSHSAFTRCRSARSASRLAATLATLALQPIACDCGTEPVERITCSFEVEPSGEAEAIEFPATAIGDSLARSFLIQNTGNSKLSDFSFDLESVNGQHYDIDGEESLSIDPADEETLTVAFRPLIVNLLASSFTVSHAQIGNAKCPTATVYLRGQGIEEPPVDAGPDDAGPGDAGPGDAGPDDAGFDAGTVDLPDGGVQLGTDSEWYAYGALEDARVDFAAVKLEDGTVLAIGGYGEEGDALDTLERLDPETGRSRIVARMAVPRGAPGAALLDDGRVAIVGGRSALVGGFGLTSLEIYDPTANTLACPAPQNGCGLDALADGVLATDAPGGRIDPFVTHTAGGLIVGLGRTLEDDAEVTLGGAVVVDITSPVSASAAQGQNALGARTGEARIAGPGGALLLVGGRVSNATNAAALNEVLRINALGVAESVATLASARADAAGAALSNGDVLVAGGHNSAGFGVLATERITDAFGGSPGVTTTDVELPVRVGGTLAALAGDILVFAGGTTTRTDDDDPLLARVPQQSADVLVPFSASYVVLDSENGLAHPRLRHRALVVGADNDTVLFVGGTSVSPRARPHPHVERYVLPDNRFMTFGLMGPGTALEAGLVAGSGASLVSAGGVDPHTGSVSAAVRAFDATNGIFVEAEPLQAPRRDHTLTRLSITDDQALLVVGGRDASGQVLSSISVLDPVNGTDRALPVSLVTPRAQHTATRLEEGNPVAPGAVLVCGGVSQGGAPLDTCEVIVPPSEPLNPQTFNESDVIFVTGRMQTGRVGHSATLLDTGEVLFVGGGDIATDQVRADLFTPDEDAPFLRSTGLPASPRRAHAAVLLGSGRVLLVGGEVFEGTLAATRSAELYVRANESFVSLPEMEEVRVAPGAFLLANGNVLVSGGARVTPDDEGMPTRSNRSSELYVAGPDGVGTFEEFSPENPVELSYGRSDVVYVDVFGRAIVAGGTHRDGVLFTGDERRTPITFVDFLQDPADALGPLD